MIFLLRREPFLLPSGNNLKDKVMVMRLRTVPKGTWTAVIKCWGTVALFLALACTAFLAVFMLTGFHTFAAESPARFWNGRVYYEAAGQQYPMDVAPYIKNGRTYVPVRYLAYALGVPEEGVQKRPCLSARAVGGRRPWLPGTVGTV